MAVHAQSVDVARAAYLGGGTYKLRQLSDVTVLFGKNGSGKSLLLRAWRDQTPEDVHYVTPERTGEMDFQPQYLQQELTFQGRKDASSRNYMPEYRRRIISRIQSYFLTRGDFRGDGSAPGSPSELEDFVNSLLSDFVIELVAAGNPPYRLSRANDGQSIGSVDQLSSGEAQLVTIALDVLTISAIWEIESKRQRIILIDEPDAHIHPDLEVRFADFLFRIADRFNLQFAIATHSTSLLAAIGQFGGLRTGVMYLTLSRLEYVSQKFTDIHKEMAACLGGHALMGPLFGAPILLVEGDDDYRIWSQVPRHHVTNLSVIPTMGDEIKRYQKALESIFASLRDPKDRPAGFALLDGDKPKPQPSAANPQKHIRFIRLQCHEAENLYLSDEVLRDMGTTWEDAVTRVMVTAESFGEKKARLLEVSRWNRLEDDIKELIEPLMQVLDPKSVHWTSRVGRTIGRQIPSGQLRAFLGEEVVLALWEDVGRPPVEDENA